MLRTAWASSSRRHKRPPSKRRGAWTLGPPATKITTYRRARSAHAAHPARTSISLSVRPERATTNAAKVQAPCMARRPVTRQPLHPCRPRRGPLRHLYADATHAWHLYAPACALGRWRTSSTPRPRGVPPSRAPFGLLLRRACYNAPIVTPPGPREPLMTPKPITQNTLFYGDNLPILREYIPTKAWT